MQKLEFKGFQREELWLQTRNKSLLERDPCSSGGLVSDHHNYQFLLQRSGIHRLQCSCLKNPRDGRAWWAAVYGVTHSRTRLTQLSSSSSSSSGILLIKCSWSLIMCRVCCCKWTFIRKISSDSIPIEFGRTHIRSILI